MSGELDKESGWELSVLLLYDFIANDVIEVTTLSKWLSSSIDSFSILKNTLKI